MPGALLLASPAWAEWPTTSVIPVPHSSDGTLGTILNGFDAYATGSESGEDLRVETLDFGAMRKGAEAPLNAIYRGRSSVKSTRPPGQELYEKEFLPGANYGGTATSLSLAAGPTPSDGSSPDEANGGPHHGAGSRPGMQEREQCSCDCAGKVQPETPACFAQCMPKLMQCAGRQ